MTSERMKQYKRTLDEEESLLASGGGALWDSLSRRQQHCSHLRHGQLKLLKQLLDATAVSE